MHRSTSSPRPTKTLCHASIYARADARPWSPADSTAHSSSSFTIAWIDFKDAAILRLLRAPVPIVLVVHALPPHQLHPPGSLSFLLVCSMVLLMGHGDLAEWRELGNRRMALSN
uniref:Uncharacterized protein n=1 Tax=Oryza brachyantha TaxID=4533 RepID=J3N980_ORYBR